MITRALVVGGAHGLGLNIAKALAAKESVEKVYIVDIDYVAEEDMTDKMMSFQFDLTNERYAFFDRFDDVDALFFTAAVKEKGPFQDIPFTHIMQAFNVNTIPALRLIDKFYSKLKGETDFYCAINISALGIMSVPMYSVYGSTKAALKSFVDTVNAELRYDGCQNRIMSIMTPITETCTNEIDKSVLDGMITCMESKWELYTPLSE